MAGQRDAERDVGHDDEQQDQRDDRGREVDDELRDQQPERVGRRRRQPPQDALLAVGREADRQRLDARASRR